MKYACYVLKTGETLHSYCKRTGENYKKLYFRCDRRGLSPDEALEGTFKPLFTGKYLYKGVSVIKLCKDRKQYEKVRRMIKAGKSIEEALKGVVNGLL